MRHILHRVIRLATLFVTIAANTSDAQDSTLYIETFDLVSPPQLPTGWVSKPAGVWTSNSSVASPGSGLNNIVVSGSDSGSVVTPVLDFTDFTAGEFQYVARRTSTFPVDGISVEASIDGGFTFPIVVVDSPFALPVASSSYELITVAIPSALVGSPSVQFRFRSFGSGGGNCRIDDVSIVGSGSVALPSFGFAAASSIAAIGSDSVRVDLSLTTTAGVGDLHGLQFDVTWPSTETVIAVERGSAVSDPDNWELSAQIGSTPGRIVLLSKTSSGLPPGIYPDLLRLVLTPVDDGGGSRDDTLHVSEIIGSKSSDTGDDAQLTTGISSHVLSVLPAVVSFSVSPDSLDMGVIEVDSMATGSLFVGNPLGTVDLEVSTVVSTVSGISVGPTTFQVAPGDSTAVVVAADGSTIPIGTFGGWLIFTHNASANPDSVWVYGQVGSTSSRGDVNDDGTTDLLDLVLAIDHVIGVSPLAPEYQERIDLYPFPEGDGEIDVRDLTVLVRAINSGLWPDGILLPGPSFASKQHSVFRGELIVVEDGSTATIRLRYPPGLRAVQLILTAPSGLEPSDLKPEDHGQFVQTIVDRHRGRSDSSVGILAYTLDGPLSADLAFNLAEVQLAPQDSLEVVFATAIDLANQRVDISFAGAEVPGHADLDVVSPFPQPYSLTEHDRVMIQSRTLRPSVVSVTIGDVLGRIVYRVDDASFSRVHPFTWDGRTSSGASVSPGLYFVQLTSGDAVSTSPVVVVQ